MAAKKKEKAKSKKPPKRRKEAKSITELLQDDALVTRALRAGVRNALRQHKRAGNPVCEWRDGKVVWIPAKKIPVDL